MAGGGQFRWSDILSMLQTCAPGMTWKDGKSSRSVAFEGRTAWVRKPPPSKKDPEYRSYEVRNLVRALRLKEEEVRKHLPNLRL